MPHISQQNEAIINRWEHLNVQFRTKNEETANPDTTALNALSSYDKESKFLTLFEEIKRAFILHLTQQRVGRKMVGLNIKGAYEPLLHRRVSYLTPGLKEKQTNPQYVIFCMSVTPKSKNYHYTKPGVKKKSTVKFENIPSFILKGFKWFSKMVLCFSVIHSIQNNSEKVRFLSRL